MGPVTGGEEKGSVETPDPVDQSQVFKANVGKTETPGGIEGIQSQVRQNVDDLQTKADEYTQNYKDQYQFDIEDAALDKAITGGNGDQDYQQAGELINRSDPGAAQQFEGAEDLRVSDVDYLQDTAGLMHLASQGQGPRYTQGMSNFDVMLMRRDPRFNDLINSITQENVALDESLDTQPGALQDAAYGYGQEQLKGAQDYTRAYLGDYRSDLIAGNEQEATAYESARAALDKGAIGQQEMAGVGGELQNYLGDRYKPQYDAVTGGYDPNKFIDYDTTDYGYQDFLDQSEAGSLNNISGLLGSGETYSESLGPQEQYTVDRGGMYDSLFNAVSGARDKKDYEQGIAAKEIRDIAGTRASKENQRIAGLRDSYDDDLFNMAQDIATERGYGADLYQPGDLAGFSRPDFGSEDLDYADMLNQAEVNQLNAIMADLGQGGYKVGSGGGASFLDSDALGNYLGETSQKRAQRLAAMDPRNFPSENTANESVSDNGGDYDRYVPGLQNETDKFINRVGTIPKPARDAGGKSSAAWKKEWKKVYGG